MSRANTSSVDTDDGYKIAILGQQNKVANQRNFSALGDEKENKNIVNSNRAKHLSSPSAKIKAKNKSKKAMSKASRKANKKK